MSAPWEDWLPTVADVGAILRARTTDPLGNELGTFTVATRPTAEQVLSIIETTVPEVYGEVGEVPVELRPHARRVAALGASLLVELTYYPEQTTSGRSAYDRLRELYETGLKRLASAVTELQQGDRLGGGDDPGPVIFGGMGEGLADRSPAAYPYDGPRTGGQGRPLGFGTNW